MALVTRSDTMECFIGTKLLRERTSLCNDTVRDARRDLVAAGWLRMLHRGNNIGGNSSSVYRLIYPTPS
jgi:hypothetical protein